VTSCGVPECASSYYEDVSFAFNNVDDSILGCTSGITVTQECCFAYFSIHLHSKDYFASSGASQAVAIQVQVIFCLNLVGFGGFIILIYVFRIFLKNDLLGDFKGISCQTDSDCAQWNTICGISGRCELTSLEKVFILL